MNSDTFGGVSVRHLLESSMAMGKGKKGKKKKSQDFAGDFKSLFQRLEALLFSVFPRGKEKKKGCETDSPINTIFRLFVVT